MAKKILEPGADWAGKVFKNEPGNVGKGTELGSKILGKGKAALEKGGDWFVNLFKNGETGEIGKGTELGSKILGKGKAALEKGGDWFGNIFKSGGEGVGAERGTLSKVLGEGSEAAGEIGETASIAGKGVGHAPLINAIMAAIDGIQGYRHADERTGIKEKDLNTKDRLRAGAGSALGGFLGLPGDVLKLLADHPNLQKANKFLMPGGGDLLNAWANKSKDKDSIFHVDDSDTLKKEFTKGAFHVTGSTKIEDAQKGGQPVPTAEGSAPNQPVRQTPGSEYAKLGAMSAMGESGGNAGATNFDRDGGKYATEKDPGGRSYGMYQITSGNETLKNGIKTKDSTMPGFLQFLAKNNPEAAAQLEAAGGAKAASSGDPKFVATWKQLAKSDPKFTDAQHEFMGKATYDPLKKAFAKKGLDLDKRSDIVKRMVFEAGVGGVGNAQGDFDKAFKGMSPDEVAKLSDSDVVSVVHQSSS